MSGLQLKTGNEKNLTYEIVEQNGTSVAVLIGDIEFDANEVLTQFISEIHTTNIEFVCSKIRKINSFGIARWINFFDNLDNKYSFNFVKCPLNFVDTAVMVPGFTAPGTIKSFYVPYECNSCDREKQELFEVQEILVSGVRESIPCDHCGNQMMVDEYVYDDLDVVARKTQR